MTAATTVIDAFVNLFSLEELAATGSFPGLGDTFASGAASPGPPAGLVARMDEAGIDRSIVTTGLLGDGTGRPRPGHGGSSPAQNLLALCREHPARLRAALTVDQIPSVRLVTEAIEDVARDPMVVAIRVVPFLLQLPINDRLWYPVYERCAALGLPVTVNVGIPGPRVKGRGQDPMLLDDVLVDFPELTVVAAHMGHPWEAVLIRLMAKFPNLHLMNSAYLAKHMDPAVVTFMNSTRGESRLIFASDHPLIDFGRALEHARKLPLSEQAMDSFLGANAARVFSWPLDEAAPAGNGG